MNIEKKRYIIFLYSLFLMNFVIFVMRCIIYLPESVRTTTTSNRRSFAVSHSSALAKSRPPATAGSILLPETGKTTAFPARSSGAIFVKSSSGLIFSFSTGVPPFGDYIIVLFGKMPIFSATAARCAAKQAYMRDENLPCRMCNITNILKSRGTPPQDRQGAGARWRGWWREAPWPAGSP